MVTILSALISQTHEEESCQGACCVHKGLDYNISLIYDEGLLV